MGPGTAPPGSVPRRPIAGSQVSSLAATFSRSITAVAPAISRKSSRSFLMAVTIKRSRWRSFLGQLFVREIGGGDQPSEDNKVRPPDAPFPGADGHRHDLAALQRLGPACGW